MGIRRLNVEFDRPTAAYMPGDMVSGRVCAEFSEPKKIRGLKLIVRGEARVQWSAKRERPDGRGHYHYETLSADEAYFSSIFYIIGSETGDTIELPVGELVWPFNIQLPLHLPSSFENEHGYIRYTIKAVFDRPWKFDHEIKVAFTVISPYDLNRRPEASLVIRQTMDKTFCCCCFCMGGLDATVMIPSSGFAPGQYIVVTVQCDNRSSVGIEKIKVSLRQQVKLHATTPRWKTRTDEIMVAEQICRTPFTNNQEDFVVISLKVPPVAASSLEYCSIIDLDYVVRVAICFDGMHCSIDRRLPVLIGSIPLYGSYTNTNPMDSIVVEPAPSAPVFPPQPSIGMPQPGNFPIQGGFVQPGKSFPEPPAAPAGFAVGNLPYPTGEASDLPPPSYEAAMYAARSIQDKGESDHVEGVQIPFAPRYPVYNYVPPNVPGLPSAPTLEKP